MWAVVVCVGLPAAYRNPTALALSLSWLAGQATYLTTGNNLPLSIYIMADIAVITIIYAKSIRHAGVKTYPSAWRHLKGFVTDLTPCDRIVLAIFLLGSWPVYVLDLHPYYRWWTLYWLTIAQFLTAGVEAFAGWYVRNPPAQTHSNILEFAPAYRRRFGAEHRPSSGILLARDEGVG